MRYYSLFALCLLFVPTFRVLAEETVESEIVRAVQMKDAIQPRNEGALWLYTSKMFEAGQWEPAGSSREDVQEVIELEGMKCYKVRLTIDWRTLMDRLSGVKLSEDNYSYYWEYMNGKGSYNYAGGDTDEIEFPAPTALDQFELTLPYPVEKGHSYIAEDSNYSVIDTYQTIKVPAGEFICTVYQILYDEDPESITRERLYMSEGVGLVRWEEYEKLDGQWSLTYQDDLIRYDLKLPVVEDVDDVENEI
jgi:hypothetical protein